MSFDVSNLSNYTDEQSDKYLYATVAEGDTLSHFTNVQTGIKTSEKIKLINTSAVWQAGGDCVWNASGSTSFTDRTLAVGKIKVQMDYCPSDLESKYTQLRLKKGSTYDMIAFQQEITDQLQNSDKNKMEMAVWNARTDSTDQYLMHFTGLRRLIATASGVLTTSTSGSTTWSEANARTVMKSFATKVVSSLPQFIGNSDVVCFMGIKEALDLKNKYITDNMYHITGEDGVQKVEGTDIKIIPVLGLSNTGEIYLMEKSNVYIGTDLEHEEEKFILEYAKEARKVRYEKAWKFGVQVAFPDRIIKYITA